MKKSAKIYIVTLVWLAAMIQFFVNEKEDAGEKVVKAFAQIEIEDYNSRIEVSGLYGQGIYGEERICNIIGNVMEELCPAAEMTVYKEKNSSAWRGISENDYGNVIIDFIQSSNAQKENYLVTKVNLKGFRWNETQKENTDLWVEEINRLYNDIGIEPIVEIYMQGRYEGKLNHGDRAALINEIKNAFNNRADVNFYYDDNKKVTEVKVYIRVN